jgi:ammonium transporter, Amt family
MAALITHLCASTCAFTWMVIEWLHLGKPSIVGVASGAMTGLVVITPASGFVDHTGAFVMGLLGAPLCYVCVFLKNKFGLDQKPNTCNRIDAFGVHAIGGMMGSLMLGFFAKPEIGGPLVAGVFYKLPTDGSTNGRQLGWQIVGIILTMLYTAWVTLILVRI